MKNRFGEMYYRLVKQPAQHTATIITTLVLKPLVQRNTIFCLCANPYLISKEKKEAKTKQQTVCALKVVYVKQYEDKKIISVSVP